MAKKRRKEAKKTKKKAKKKAKKRRRQLNLQFFKNASPNESLERRFFYSKGFSGGAA